jgi:hypothetical protein
MKYRMPRNVLDGFRTSQRLQHNNVFSPGSEEMYHITKAGRTGATARKQRSAAAAATVVHLEKEKEKEPMKAYPKIWP